MTIKAIVLMLGFSPCVPSDGGGEALVSALFPSSVSSQAMEEGGGADSTEKIVLESIRISGNYRTRERIVRRELLFHENDTLTLESFAKKTKQSQRNLLNINLFVTAELTQKINETAVSGQLRRASVEVVLKEQWYLLGFPVLELADRNFNEWWYDRGRDLQRIIYGGYLSYQNVTGNNDRLRFLAQFGFVPRFDVSYSIPYIDKKQKTGITAGLSFVKNKSLAFKNYNDKLVFLNSETFSRQLVTPFITISHRPKFFGYHYLNFTYSNISITDTILQLNPNYLGNNRHRQRYSEINYTHYFDRRDRGQYPLQGYFYGFQLGRAGIFVGDDVGQWVAVAVGSKYWSLGKRWYASGTAKVRARGPNQQPYLQTRGLGYGSDLVRGYELYVVDGQSFMLLKTNLRFEAFKRTISLQKFIKIRQFNTFPLAIYPSIYADWGYINNSFGTQSASKLSNRPLVGVGAGLDFVTWYNFVFRLNYSVNHKGESRPYFSIGREY